MDCKQAGRGNKLKNKLQIVTIYWLMRVGIWRRFTDWLAMGWRRRDGPRDRPSTGHLLLTTYATSRVIVARVTSYAATLVICPKLQQALTTIVISHRRKIRKCQKDLHLGCILYATTGPLKTWKHCFAIFVKEHVTRHSFTFP